MIIARISNVNFNTPKALLSKEAPNCDLKQSFYVQPVHNDFNKYLINFTGIKEDFANKCYSSPAELKTLRDSAPDDAIVGALPKPWGLAIKKSGNDEGEFIKEFGKAVQNLRINGLRLEDDEAFENVFRRAGILNKDDPKGSIVIVDELNKGEGAFGDVFLLADNKNNKQYALKVFRNPGIALAQGHGMLMETNRMAYFQKNIKADDWTQFYFAGIKDGYILSEFLDDENLKRPKSTANLNHWGLIGHDDKDNRIGGIRFDYGGVQVINSYLNTNASARQKFGKLMISTDFKDEMQKLIEKYKQSPNKETASLLLAVFTDSRTKDKVLRGNILKTLLDSPNDERITQLIEAGRLRDVHKLIKDNPTPEQQLLIAEYLHCLDAAERLQMFKKLAQSEDEEVKIALSCSMGHLEKDEEILEAFEILSKNPSPDLRLSLVTALDYLEEKEQIPHFKQLLENADHDTMMEMAECLWIFDWKDDKKKAYKLLMEKADKNNDGELKSFLERAKVNSSYNLG